VEQVRILLIKSFSPVSKVSSASPPLGVMSLAAYLRQKAGAQVRILDLRFLRDPIRAVHKAVEDLSPKLVGISALTPEARVMHAAARAARAAGKEVLIVAGGPHPTAFPEDTLAARDIDVAVLGEGEETLLELVQRVEAGPRQSEVLRCAQDDGCLADTAEPGREDGCSHEWLRKVRGIAYRGGEAGEVVRTEPRPYMEDLDALPMPAWDLVDLKPYWRISGMASIGVRPYMAVFTSRGCPYRCSYCHNLFGKKFRAASPERVVEEIAAIEKQLGVRDIEVYDDIANLERKRLDGILEGLLARSMHPTLSFPNGVRTDLLEEGTIDLLKEVGTGEVSVAVETASPRLQKMLGKNLDLDRVRVNIERFAKRRIFTRGFMMLGFPTETEAEMRATIGYACDSPLHLAFFFTVNPFGGTRIREQFRELGKLPADARSIDFEYYGAPFNGSEVSDSDFRKLYRYAYARFYGNPVRAYRIARDRPSRRDIPLRVYKLLSHVVSFKRLQEEALPGEEEGP